MTPKAVMGKREFHNAAPMPVQSALTSGTQGQVFYQRYKNSVDGLSDSIVLVTNAAEVDRKAEGDERA